MGRALDYVESLKREVVYGIDMSKLKSLMDIDKKKIEERTIRQKEYIESLEKEIERLHTIIKEVREYIEDRYDGEALTHTFDKDNVKELLEILDKLKERIK